MADDATPSALIPNGLVWRSGASHGSAPVQFVANPHAEMIARALSCLDAPELQPSVASMTIVEPLPGALHSHWPQPQVASKVRGSVQSVAGLMQRSGPSGLLSSVTLVFGQTWNVIA